MKIFLIFTIALLVFSCSQQNQSARIKLIVFSKPIPESSNIFITGNHFKLANWNPNKVKLYHQKDHIWEITVCLPINMDLEFKFTRGSWNTEALDNEGGIPANHKLKVIKDTTIIFEIKEWKDTYLNSDKRNITGNFVLHRKMEFPGLKSRDIIVWLPPDYQKHSDKKYPVLYMHDGQNLFDPKTSFLGIDWQVDETADKMIRENEIEPLIIVGIYNTENRSDEYSETPLGKIYINFLITKLKPFIDKKYRTQKNAKYTAVGGSSMGGLISFILVWEYSHIFSKAICMSPAFKYKNYNYTQKVNSYNGIKKNIKVYIDNGGVDLENQLQPGIEDMLLALKKMGYSLNEDLLWFRDINAPHNEGAWSARFWRPLKFLFAK